MNIDGSARKHTKTHACQTEADRAGAIYLRRWCDGSFVFCDLAAEISAQVMVRRRITRFICRICPLVRICLSVGSTLVMSPKYELQHYKQNDMRAQRRSDQPQHPPSLIRVFAVRTVGSWGPNVSSCGQWRLWSDWVDVQAELSLRWVGAEVIFVGLAAHIKASHAVKKVLHSVLLQCARGKSSVARKRKSIPKLWSGKKLLKIVTHKILNFIWVS